MSDIRKEYKDEWYLNKVKAQWKEHGLEWTPDMKGKSLQKELKKRGMPTLIDKIPDINDGVNELKKDMNKNMANMATKKGQEKDRRSMKKMAMNLIKLGRDRGIAMEIDSDDEQSKPSVQSTDPMPEAEAKQQQPTEAKGSSPAEAPEAEQQATEAKGSSPAGAEEEAGEAGDTNNTRLAESDTSDDDGEKSSSSESESVPARVINSDDDSCDGALLAKPSVKLEPPIEVNVANNPSVNPLLAEKKNNKAGRIRRAMSKNICNNMSDETRKAIKGYQRLLKRANEKKRALETEVKEKRALEIEVKKLRRRDDEAKRLLIKFQNNDQEREDKCYELQEEYNSLKRKYDDAISKQGDNEGA